MGISRESAVPLLYLDSNVFIYALAGQRPFNLPALEILQKIESGSNDCVLSTIVYSEVIGFSKQPESLDTAHAFLRGLRHTTFVPVDLRIARRAGYLRNKYGSALKLADALHLATALEHGADVFVTNDLPLTKVSSKVISTQTLGQNDVV